MKLSSSSAASSSTVGGADGSSIHDYVAGNNDGETTTADDADTTGRPIATVTATTPTTTMNSVAALVAPCGEKSVVIDRQDEDTKTNDSNCDNNMKYTTTQQLAVQVQNGDDQSSTSSGSTCWSA